MSWIRYPVYIITTHDQIQCMGDGADGCVFTNNRIWYTNVNNLNDKKRAEIVLKHLYEHYLDYLSKLEFSKADLIASKMEEIYLQYIPNRIFRYLYKKHRIKFLLKYDVD